MFQFQQFTIYDDRCSMKVGTDGVLLGSWVEVEQAARILDIGSGSGLLALMCAQRSTATITGIEIEAGAVKQSRENIAASPFCTCIEIVAGDVRTFFPAQRFDCIVSNPPFFEEKTLPPNAKRALARHTAHLSFAELLEQAYRLLLPLGTFHLIVPAVAVESLCQAATALGFHCYRLTKVITKKGKEPVRALLTFQKGGDMSSVCQEDRLCIYDEFGKRTAEFAALTQDFYLY